MKRTNTVVFFILSAIIIAAIIVLSLWEIPIEYKSNILENDLVLNETTVNEPETTKSHETEMHDFASNEFLSQIECTETEPFETETPDLDIESNETSFFDEPEIETSVVLEELNEMPEGNALFIGDSRTVGLMEYADIEDADFFCTVGMSVFNIYKKTVSVADVGRVSINDLLNNKKYDRIYVMLGINELGYKSSYTVSKYKELMELIKASQADSKIFIQANLHVTKSRSDSDKVINNSAINHLNTELSKLADGDRIFYIDANVLFDDNSGGLSVDKSIDSAHLYAKYYYEWGKWIALQTDSLIKEGEI